MCLILWDDLTLPIDIHLMVCKVGRSMLIHLRMYVCMYVCMYVWPPVERSLLIFSLSRRQPTPPEGLTSTQTEAIIPLPLVCPMTTRGNPRDTHPLPFPVKSHQDGRSHIIYCDTGWKMVRAIRDRSRKKPRCSGTRRNLVKQLRWETEGIRVMQYQGVAIWI